MTDGVSNSKLKLSSNPKIKAAYLRTYTSTYLQEEIQRESEIRNLGGFGRFLELAAFENGNFINFAKIARATNLSSPTVKNYFQILVDTLIVYEIPAWSRKIKEQIQKSSRYYFFDNGVLNSLTGNLGVELNESSFLYGKLYETFVVQELIKMISTANLGLKLYNYRNQSQNEIDLIIQKTAFSNPVAIEIKSSKHPEIPRSHVINSFIQEHKKSKAIVICRTEQAFTKDRIEYLPTLRGIKKVIELAS